MKKELIRMDESGNKYWRFLKMFWEN